jgi:hypothetical protein
MHLVHQSRCALLAITVAVLAVVQVALAPLAAAAALQRVPVAFVLTPADCPDIQTTITGSGEYFFRTNERTDKDGVTHIVVNVSANGTAVDEAGNTYRFNYHNNQQVTVQPGGFPMQVDFSDHFNLIAGGTAGNVHAGFVVRLTFSAPDQLSAEVIVNERGTPSCDVI